MKNLKGPSTSMKFPTLKGCVIKSAEAYTDPEDNRPVFLLNFEGDDEEIFYISFGSQPTVVSAAHDRMGAVVRSDKTTMVKDYV